MNFSRRLTFEKEQERKHKIALYGCLPLILAFLLKRVVDVKQPKVLMLNHSCSSSLVHSVYSNEGQKYSSLNLKGLPSKEIVKPLLQVVLQHKWGRVAKFLVYLKV